MSVEEIRKDKNYNEAIKEDMMDMVRWAVTYGPSTIPRLPMEYRNNITKIVEFYIDNVKKTKT